LRYARDGFELTPMGAQSFEWSCLLYEGYDVLLDAYQDLSAGDLHRQPALARTIELLASDGPDAYYRGPIAQAISDATEGALAVGDLTTHRGRWVDPLIAGYRGLEIAELPPPTQGVTALEAFRILDGFELPPDGVDRQHLLLETIKIALSDRDEHVTDPDAMTVLATELLHEDWIERRRATIDPVRARPRPPGVAQTGGTAYLCSADEDGLLVSFIQSNFLAFGSGVRVPEWGINLNNRGSSFSLDAASVNVLAPSKLPMHTLIPAMALRDGRPELVFGSMGADAQAQIHVQLLARIVDDRADLQSALDAPRWRVDPSSWQIQAESAFAPEWLDELSARGHDLERAQRGDPGFGHAHAIAPSKSGYAVATDPRAEGAALGL
jgi:gamma-glutamyltranspeptidase / glutathione hydrolase